MSECKCGEPSDGWPDTSQGAKRDDELCQVCWEAQCSESWWETHGGLVGLLPSAASPATERTGSR